MNDANNIIPLKPHRGQKLRETRHARGLSLQALSALIGADPSTISRWESRRDFHQFARFLKALYRLGIKPEEFLGLDDEDVPQSVLANTG